MNDRLYVKGVKNIIAKSGEKWLSFTLIFRCENCVTYLQKQLRELKKDNEEDIRREKGWETALLEQEGLLEELFEYGEENEDNDDDEDDDDDEVEGEGEEKRHILGSLPKTHAYVYDIDQKGCFVPRKSWRKNVSEIIDDSCQCHLIQPICFKGKTEVKLLFMVGGDTGG